MSLSQESSIDYPYNIESNHVARSVRYVQLESNIHIYKYKIPIECDLIKPDYLIVHKKSNNDLILSEITFQKNNSSWNINLNLYKNDTTYIIYEIDTSNYYNTCWGYKKPEDYQDSCLKIIVDTHTYDTIARIDFVYIAIFLSESDRKLLELLGIDVEFHPRESESIQDRNMIQDIVTYNDLFRENNNFDFSYSETDNKYIIKPNQLIIDVNDKNINIDGVFRIICGGTIFFEMPILMMMAFDKIEQNTRIIINIPIHYWIRQYLIVYQKIRVCISDANNINHVTLLTKRVDCNDNWCDKSLTPLDKSSRCDNLSVGSLTEQIEYYSIIKTDLNDTSNIDIELYFKRSKGLFVYCNVEELSCIELCIDNYILIKYDSILMELYCKQLSTKLIYIPFDLNQDNYSDINIQSFIDGIDMRKVLCVMRLSFRNKQQNIMIASQTLNDIKYYHGICGTKYIS